VLDCCTKPSHDLGRRVYFESMFGEMLAYLSGRGVKAVLVACPSCFLVFQHHGKCIRVRTAYEVIHESGGIDGAHPGDREVVVHDPCALRNEADVHQAIRGLLTGMGLTVAEMEPSGKRTVCCEEGGREHCLRFRANHRHQPVRQLQEQRISRRMPKRNYRWK